MRYNININNVKAIEWGLILSQAYVFSWIYELPSWAECVTYKGKIFYFASRTKAIEELPILTDKEDTIYRYYKQLEELKLIVLEKIDGKDYISITEKGKSWNNSKTDIGNESDLLGNESENNSELNPTYNIYKYIDNILMSKIEISDDLKEFTITEKGIKTKLETDENTGKYFKIAEAFRHRFINNLNDAGAPTVHQENATFKNYVHPIRMLLEKDKVSKEKLHDVYVFLGSEEGSFWKPNILSTKTLREKIAKLITQEVQSKQRQSKQNKNNFSNNPGI